eukprot:gene17819-24880_t
MGSSKSKSKEEEEDSIYDRTKIFWDVNGNLIYDPNAGKVDKETQIRKIMEVDVASEESGKTWCVVDSAWLASWLAFVHFDKENSPNPGPCRNNRLIKWDYHEGKWVGRSGLLMAVPTSGGDYRRVTPEAWERLKSFYPGSGPTITMEFNLKEKNATGDMSVESWVIIDPPSPPEDVTTAKPKKRFLFAHKINKSPNEEEKVEEGVVESKVESSEDEKEDNEVPVAVSSTKIRNEPKVNYQKVNSTKPDKNSSFSDDKSESEKSGLNVPLIPRDSG